MAWPPAFHSRLLCTPFKKGRGNVRPRAVEDEWLDESDDEELLEAAAQARTQLERWMEPMLKTPVAASRVDSLGLDERPAKRTKCTGKSEPDDSSVNSTQNAGDWSSKTFGKTRAGEDSTKAAASVSDLETMLLSGTVNEVKGLVLPGGGYRFASFKEKKDAIQLGTSASAQKEMDLEELQKSLRVLLVLRSREVWYRHFEAMLTIEEVNHKRKQRDEQGSPSSRITPSPFMQALQLIKEQTDGQCWKGGRSKWTSSKTAASDRKHEPGEESDAQQDWRSSLLGHLQSSHSPPMMVKVPGKQKSSGGLTELQFGHDGAVSADVIQDNISEKSPTEGSDESDLALYDEGCCACCSRDRLYDGGNYGFDDGSDDDLYLDEDYMGEDGSTNTDELMESNNFEDCSDGLSDWNGDDEEWYDEATSRNIKMMRDDYGIFDSEDSEEGLILLPVLKLCPTRKKAT